MKETTGRIRLDTCKYPLKTSSHMPTDNVHTSTDLL